MTGARDLARVSACAQLSPDLIAAYAKNTLGQVAAWSVEAHLPGCIGCRSVLAGEVDRSRLERNRSVLLARLGLPVPGAFERLAARCGIPAHVWRLFSVTPSLRRSWLAGMALVLVAAVGCARLATAVAGRPSGVMLFLLLAPLLPLAGVAAAFHRQLDPAADLAIAAPVSGIWLLCVRATAVIATALVPVMLAGLVVPGTGWLSLLVVLPALALSVVALALATLTPPVRAAVITGTAWVAVVIGVSLAVGSPAVAYGGTAQVVLAAILTGAGWLLAARRHVFEIGWNR